MSDPTRAAKRVKSELALCVLSRMIPWRQRLELADAGDRLANKRRHGCEQAASVVLRTGAPDCFDSGAMVAHRSMEPHEPGATRSGYCAWSVRPSGAGLIQSGRHRQMNLPATVVRPPGGEGKRQRDKETERRSDGVPEWQRRGEAEPLQGGRGNRFERTTTTVCAQGIRTYGGWERRKSRPRRAAVRLVGKVGRWGEKCSRGVRAVTSLCEGEWARQDGT
jgi:hypothetical protein